MRRAVPFLLALLALSRAVAEEPTLEESLKALFDQALRINIVVRVIPDGAGPVMHVRRSKLTIPGRAVVVRFEGSNIRVRANLTPYLLEDGRLMLVAQGEVWLSEPSAENAVKGLSSIESLPIELGEKIFFYPLGVPDPVQGVNHFNLALEIEIICLESSDQVTSQ